MSLTLVEVEHIAELARLDLSEDEKERYCQQLSAILDYAARLQTVDTGLILPTSSMLPQHNVLRQDAAAESLPVDLLLYNAPETQDNQFRVPPVLE